MAAPLSSDWSKRSKSTFDFIVIGSGYGGAITAARLAGSDARPSVCILERGKEWAVGEFPDSAGGWLSNQRNDLNPLGLYEVLNYADISILKGSGLGGTSLVNANVAIVPDDDAFRQDGWPAAVNTASLDSFYRIARDTLFARPYPDAMNLPKVQALARRGAQLGLPVEPLDIAVTTVDRTNDQGVHQPKCTGCGDCVSGCNVGSKNTLAMNYLPLAKSKGAEIYTQCEVESIEKLSAGGWRVHGYWVRDALKRQKFSLDAGNVILAAGSVNSTEILLRSAEKRGLAISPAAGSKFGGNGDFFGLSYNGNYETRVLGFGVHPPDQAWEKNPSGPSIVASLRYRAGDPSRWFTIEDLSFPAAALRAAQVTFATLPNKEDTDVGDETREMRRAIQDTLGIKPYDPEGALNHTMLYLCMGFDDQRGYFVLGKRGVEIRWPGAGRQPVFGMINEELRRHARREGSSFLANPIWEFMKLPVRHLVTAHPLGGLPMGEDYLAGAVDEWGRVFSSDGSVHDGLFVADGAVLPAALGVNPFLTIAAVAERIAARKIEEIGGNPYPKPPAPVAIPAVDPIEAISKSETELERIFERIPSGSIQTMLNAGGRTVDPAARRIRNDDFWKGCFPNGHLLNAMSSALFTSFKKRFFKQGGKFMGVTSDSDGAIDARNSIEEIELKKPAGDLKPGRYILLRYLDPPWQGFYDVFRVINEDLLIGRVYLGAYPDGLRMFTFPMTRRYAFSQMTVEDHRSLYASAVVPTALELDGAWRMDTISNANHAAGVAWLAFENKPDGRLESRYQLMGLIEGLVTPSFAAGHFQLNDFTPLRDEIRKIDDELFIGKWVTSDPALIHGSLPVDLGLFHREPAGPDGKSRWGFYYLLTRAEGAGRLSSSTILSPWLDHQLPRGVGMTFDEEMVGRIWNGMKTPSGDRSGDLAIAARGDAGASACSFQVRMHIGDVNEFVDGPEHEARLSGKIVFSDFLGGGPREFTLDSGKSYFNYLRVNTQTGEAEMRYFLEWTTPQGRRFQFEGKKYMQKDASGPREVLSDYTTLYTHLYEYNAGGRDELATGLLKFRTFEDLAAVGNLAGFLAGFRVTGATDPGLQLAARMRFLAFTGQFVQREYDPLAPQAEMPPAPRAAAAGGGSGSEYP
ncbi:MAG: GMC family oxidoreductase [Bryobacteraceae bacterium]